MCLLCHLHHFKLDPAAAGETNIVGDFWRTGTHCGSVCSCAEFHRRNLRLWNERKAGRRMSRKVSTDALLLLDYARTVLTDETQVQISTALRGVSGDDEGNCWGRELAFGEAESIGNEEGRECWDELEGMVDGIYSGPIQVSQPTASIRREATRCAHWPCKCPVSINLDCQG